MGKKRVVVLARRNNSSHSRKNKNKEGVPTESLEYQQHMRWGIVVQNCHNFYSSLKSLRPCNARLKSYASTSDKIDPASLREKRGCFHLSSPLNPIYAPSIIILSCLWANLLKSVVTQCNF